MDPVTRLKLMGALTTAVLPTAAVLGTLVAARRLAPREGPRPGAVGLAAVVGLLVAWIGVNGWPGVPPREVAGWVPLIAAGAGLIGLGLDRARGGLPAAALAVAALAIGAWRTLAPLAIWDAGVVEALARTAWVIEPVGLGVVAWLVLDRAARADTPAPIVLGPLAVAFGAGAVALALTGSARLGQTGGALAVVFGTLSLVGWRWPAFRPGRGALAAGVTALTLLMLIGHFYVELPRPVAALVLMAPLAAGTLIGRTGRLAVLVAGALATVPAGASVYLAQVAQSEPATPTGAGAAPVDAPADDDGTYYPY